MTADIRTAAQREGERKFAHLDRKMSVAEQMRVAFYVEGAVWAAARLTPTREQIAELEVALGNGKFLRLGTPVADAVLALMKELAET